MIELGTYGERFTSSGRRAIQHAVDEAHRRGQNYVSLMHILHALAAEDRASFGAFARNLGMDAPSAAALVAKGMEGSPGCLHKGVEFAPEVISLFRGALSMARSHGRRRIDAADLLLVLLRKMRLTLPPGGRVR